MSSFKTLVVDAHPHGIANEKTGTFWTAVMHIFCGIVGAGVLALPHSVAWLGWVGGPFMIIVFWLISCLTSWLLADAYEVNGVENGRYHHAVRNILGQRYGVIVSVFQLANIFLINITFSITGATAMAAMGTLVCGGGACFDSMWKMSCIFGAVEVLLSQVPSLESAWWVSTLGVVTSTIYSTIALALGIKNGGLRVLYHPTGAFSALLWFVEISMGIVCACATVASVRGIILNWTTYKLFAS
ncbi:Amino acid permease 2 [Auxenochlorella protothecoides]|uniref:Amino acid permease 2 n=1 Tax=Auxenochlorella protothecoides TaxID=3075 RepID=A0A087SHM7_AUXPR|nr:Amino acid permease 2 [Auxenochlorella protothecoides]KFM25231.1 Amino acid permease 2 [Auxenochlorella protothecoides]